MIFNSMIEAMAFFTIFVLLVVLACAVFIIWTLVDMLTARNEHNWKILWLLVIVLLPVLGSLLYYFIGRQQKSAGKKRSRRA